jgi:hypothetical protein
MYDARDGVLTGLTAIMAWLAVRLGIFNAAFGTSPDFSYMRRIAPERNWAVAFWVVANVGAIGLVTRNSAVRLLSILVVATAHGVFAGCLLMSDDNIWSGTYIVIACMGYYLAYRRSRAGL